MKVFVITEFTQIDYDTTINNELFESRESAVKAYEELREMAIADANNALDADEIEIEENEAKTSFDIYKDGCAVDWNISIIMTEKEINK